MEIWKKTTHFLHEKMTRMGEAISPEGVGKKIAEAANKVFIYLSHPPYVSRFAKKVFTHKYYTKSFTKETIDLHKKEIEELSEKVGQLLTIKESCLLLRTLEYYWRENWVAKPKDEEKYIPKHVENFVNTLKKKNLLKTPQFYDARVFSLGGGDPFFGTQTQSLKKGYLRTGYRNSDPQRSLGRGCG